MGEEDHPNAEMIGAFKIVLRFLVSIRILQFKPLIENAFLV
jgi:hypothetical protein